MIRTQIQLPEQVADRLRRMADEQHASMAELIRRAISSFFASSSMRDTEQRYARAAAAAGAFASGDGNFSRDHDKLFAEAART